MRLRFCFINDPLVAKKISFNRLTWINSNTMSIKGSVKSSGGCLGMHIMVESNNSRQVLQSIK